jgi:hypothetical protein
MWYLITFGGGLVIGIVFLIFALRERSKRRETEQSLSRIAQQLEQATNIAAGNAKVADDLKADNLRLEERLYVLRKTLQEAQERLLRCNDPKTIKDWLDEELKAEVI